MSSEFPNEAAQVVNAVTLAYVKTAMDANNTENEMRLTRLREEYAKRKADVDLFRDQLVKLSTELAAGDKEVLKDRDKLTADSYASFSFQLTDVQIKRMAAQTHLQELENERPAAAGRPNPADRALRRVEALVNRDPRVVALREKIDKARESGDKSAKVSRGGNDPAIVQANTRAQALAAQLARLRDELRVEVAEELAAGDPSGGDAFERDVESARSDVRRLTNLERSLTDRLRQIDVENKNSGSNALKLEFARQNLDTGNRVLEAIRSNVDQAEFEAKSPMARLRREFPARASNRPTSNNRVRVMALSPICLMATIVGLLVLMELQASRVGDPDDLPRRVHLNVLGVVPPLPQVHNHDGDGHLDRNGHATPPRTAAQEARSQRQLEEFVQSLDHLRVALCAAPATGRASGGAS